MASLATAISRSRGCAQTPKVGMHTGMCQRHVKPQPRSVLCAGWKSPFSPDPAPPPKAQLDVGAVGLALSVITTAIMLSMSIKADIKELSDKFDRVDLKYDKVKAENVGLATLTGRLQTDVNIALTGHIIAGRD